MPLTKAFKETVAEVARENQEFRQEILRAAVNMVLEGELVAGKLALRDYINATGLMGELCAKLGKHESSIRRMLGASGSPTLENFVSLLRVCADHEKLGRVGDGHAIMRFLGAIEEIGNHENRLVFGCTSDSWKGKQSRFIASRLPPGCGAHDGPNQDGAAVRGL